MPPRIDPYSNKTHQRIDIVLVAITLVLMVFAFHAVPRRSSTKAGGSNNNTPRAAHAQATSLAKK